MLWWFSQKYRNISFRTSIEDYIHLISRDSLLLLCSLRHLSLVSALGLWASNHIDVVIFSSRSTLYSEHSVYHDRSLGSMRLDFFLTRWVMALFSRPSVYRWNHSNGRPKPPHSTQQKSPSHGRFSCEKHYLWSRTGKVSVYWCFLFFVVSWSGSSILRIYLFPGVCIFVLYEVQIIHVIDTCNQNQKSFSSE